MYSFLVAAGLERDQQRTLDVSGRITREIMPDFGQPLTLRSQVLPEIEGGWYILYPENVKDQLLVSEYTDPEYSVIAFGYPSFRSQKTMADICAEQWRGGGLDAVRSLDTSFSAVIIDRKRGELFICSDSVGHRTLRYHTHKSCLLISPYDVSIVATGLCDVEYSDQSIASLISWGWIIGGCPLLKGIKACHPCEYIHWDRQATKVSWSPNLTTESRIEPADIKSRDRQIELMVEHMRDNARDICAKREKVKLELSAGLDSRAVLGILLSSVGADIIEAQTAGQPDSYEVKTAEWLARQYKFAHWHYSPQAESHHVFSEHSELIALVSNGEANSKRALRPLPKFEINCSPCFIGNGGEIYGEFFHPSPLRHPKVSEYSLQAIADLLVKGSPFITNLRWTDGAMVESLRQKVLEMVHCYAQISNHPDDIFNLFYLYERYCRWGARPKRIPWSRNRYALFDSPVLVRMAYQLPSPISQASLLHRSIIKKSMPLAYYRLVNRRKFLPLYPYPKLAKVFAELLRRVNQTGGQVRSKLSLTGGQTLDEVSGRLAQVYLKDDLTDMLLRQNSLCCRVLTRDTVEALLNSHFDGRKDNFHLIGWLVSIEQWADIVQATKRLAENAL